MNGSLKQQAFFNIVSAIICLTLFAVLFLAELRSFGGSGIAMSPFDGGWTDENGIAADFSDIVTFGSPVTYTKEISGDELSERSLCFRSKNVLFKVYFGNSMIYEYCPESPKLFGISYGQYYHCIYFPHFEGTETVRIEAESVYNDNTGFFYNFFTGDATEYMRFLYASNLPKFAVSFMLFSGGFMLIIIGVILKKYLGDGIFSVISLGSFAVVSGMWTCTETMILQIISQSPAAVHFMNYVSLMLLPVPSVTFAASITDQRESRFVPAAYICVILNLACSIILTVLGISDYHYLLWVTHAVILAGLIFVICMIAKGYKKRLNDRSVYYALSISFVITVIMGTIDLFRYRFVKENTDSGFFLRAGLLIFTLFMSSYTLTELIHLSRMGRKAELMKELAYTDTLTGMFNRAAFAEEEKLISESGKAGQVCFVQFDINNLKTSNDVYGHSEGDKQIIAGAKAISFGFGRIGKCYRTGGDEFIAILHCPINSPKIIRAEKDLKEYTERYNLENAPPVKLQIAYGIAQYDGRDITETEKEADKKMYKMKKSMKADEKQETVNNA